jgi:hypothetical protein
MVVQRKTCEMMPNRRAIATLGRKVAIGYFSFTTLAYRMVANLVASHYVKTPRENGKGL